jgi:hypothetical protein
MKQMEIEQRTKEKQMELDSVAMEKEKDRRRDLLVAEIKSAGYGAMQDIDKNMQSDYADQMDTLRKTDEFQQTMGLKQTIQASKDSMNRQKLAIEQQKLAAMQNMKQTDLQIAKENKNKYDVKKTDKNKK